jgi:hypothetical protein
MSERERIAVTVYNGNTALIQDRRVFALASGKSTMDFRDVAATIEATSVSFASLTDPAGTRVLEQNYLYDLVNSAALLQRYIDQPITVVAEDGMVFNGRLLSGEEGRLILQGEDGRVHMIRNTAHIQFPELPEGLITRPTLRWLLDSAGGEQRIELTYLAGGLTWRADYNILLARGATSLDLNGWITIANTSGTRYPDALLKVVAGDLHRVAPEPADEGLRLYSAAAPDAPAVEQREFFEYQLYQIARPVTLEDKETKQIEFVAATDVPARLFYVFDPTGSGIYGGDRRGYHHRRRNSSRPVQTWVNFSTAKGNGLGEDLPAGLVRCYQNDADGAALLIGEDTIDHTATGEEVELLLGDAFDLRGYRTESNKRQISEAVAEVTFEITLYNRKDEEAVEIRIPEYQGHKSWTLMRASHAYERHNADIIEFRVTVPAQGRERIAYTVQVRG